jgi:hypothetical protein
MSKIQIIITLFTVLIISCKRPIHEKFIEKYNLDKFDTVFIVSSVSCGGCINDYFKNKKLDPKSILVLDSNSTNEFIIDLKKRRHININQQQLDLEFDYFGNILILYKTKDSFAIEKFPKF